MGHKQHPKNGKDRVINNVQTDYKSAYNGYRKWDSKSWFLDFDSLHHFKRSSFREILILYSQNIWIAFFFFVEG